MAERMHRAQILLPPEQHKAIREIALEENRSISDVVRDLVQQYLDERSRSARLQNELEALNGGIYPGDILAESRAEREEQIARTQKGEDQA
jgi:Arc/MetJ-type ribon-helix-helix transcriptional regulator